MITQPCPECGYWTGHGPTCTYQSRVTIRTTSTDSVPTTPYKRDPADVLREWDAVKYARSLANLSMDRLESELASALRDTLAERDALHREHCADLDQIFALRAKLDKAEAAVDAAFVVASDGFLEPGCDSVRDLRTALAALAAYDKEPRDGHE